MDQRQNTTPSKLSTRYFPANSWQFRGSVSYVPRPRRRLTHHKSLLFLLLLIAVIGTYLVVRLFAW